MNRRIVLVLLISILLLLFAAQCSPAQEQPKAAPAPAQQEAVTVAPADVGGKVLLEERCTKCHGLDKTTSKKKSAEDWKTTVERMISKGAVLSADEQKILIDYLAQTYPK